MKVLVLTHEFWPFRGGIATYVENLSTAATALGHEIVLCAPDFGEDLSVRDKERFAFRVERYRSGPYSARRLPGLIYRSEKFSRVRGYDRIHCVDAAYIMGMAVVNRFRKAPFVATVHGTEILSMPKSRQARWLGVTDMFLKPDRFFTNSAFTRDLLLDRFPTLRERPIDVTPLGVDEFWKSEPEKPGEVLPQLGIDSGSKTILTVARLDSRKGHLSVIRALAEAPESLRREVTYVVVGERNNPDYEALLIQQAEDAGVKIVMAGRVTDQSLLDLYASCDLFCMPGEADPKKVEGFGLVYLEAAAQGLPSLASRIGGVPEVVKDGQTGVLVDAGDVQSLSNHMVELLTDDQKRAEMGRKARKHADTFSWRRCAELTYGGCC